MRSKIDKITKISDSVEHPKNQGVTYWAENNIPLFVPIIVQLKYSTVWGHILTVRSMAIAIYSKVDSPNCRCGHLHTFMVVFMFDFVQFCFIFGFMLLYPWEPQHYLYSLPQYIFCTFLWFNKNTFPHSSELRKHWTHLVLSQPLYFDLNIDVFDSVSRPSLYYLDYTSVPSNLSNIYLFRAS